MVDGWELMVQIGGVSLPATKHQQFFRLLGDCEGGLSDRKRIAECPQTLHSTAEQTMSYKGRVKNGVVVLPPEVKFSEGAEVEVTPITKPEHGDFTEMLLAVAKRVRGLPRDLAKQHDHYLYGTPTR